MTEYIGASLARPDAPNKVTGAARYPADLTRPGMLHMQVIFAQSTSRAHPRHRYPGRLEASGRRGRADGG